MDVLDRPSPPEHWEWATERAIDGSERFQDACEHGARLYGLDPDEYPWEELGEKLVQLSRTAVAEWDEEYAKYQEEKKRQKAERQRREAAEAVRAVAARYSDWETFCEYFSTLADALAHVARIPNNSELLELADKCECTVDKDLDWPEYREAIVAEITECWPD